MADGTEALMTGAEVAEAFRVSGSTVARWARDGDLEAIKTPGGRGQLRFRRDDVLALLGRTSSDTKAAS